MNMHTFVSMLKQNFKMHIHLNQQYTDIHEYVNTQFKNAYSSAS